MRLSENGMYNDPKGRVYSLKARSRLRASFIVCRKNNWKKIVCKLFPLKKSCAIQQRSCGNYEASWKFSQNTNKFGEIFMKRSGKFIPGGIWQHRYWVVTPRLRFRHGRSITYIFSKSGKVKSENFHASFAKSWSRKLSRRNVEI